MRINHAAIYVKDLEGMRSFYETYFKGSANQKYHNPKTGLQTYFLSFEGESRLELMTRPDLQEHVREPYEQGLIHLAFSVGSREKVDELTEQLRADGYEVISGPRTTGDSYYESCILDPEGNQIEIVE